MNFKTLFAALALLGSAVAQDAGGMTVNTPPSIVVCQPAALSWTGGQGPYIVAIIPGGQASAAALETVNDNVSGNTITWKVDIAPETEISVKITDSQGAIQYSSPVKVQNGDTSCVGQTSAGAATGDASATSGAVSASAAGSAPAAGTSAATSAAASGDASKAASSAATSAAASGASAATSAKASGAGSSSTPASSAAASSSSSASSGAMPFGVQIPAVVLAAVGGVAALL
ncbi:hypothetical protein CI109_103010 [Kwoniella shandongensis]|uniref:Uncharacterized protein n=1 Tax=Kwoniella shandongensis TaxID=1734106 RepID=A0A5M6C885_9TREE|nr:uncharacterized protein CI109_000197 [Kwoniella shandongensis]KAA5531356.1 hypothetical protein CI109_000197 [Kwoniella shandongensis]